VERNPQILRNKAEVLGRRKTELLEKIAERERMLADLSEQYDRRLASTRIDSAIGASSPLPAKALEKRGRLRREAFRQAFIVGLGFSLFLGLVAVFSR
jgi:hypothetical protein